MEIENPLQTLASLKVVSQSFFMHPPFLYDADFLQLLTCMSSRIAVEMPSKYQGNLLKISSII